MKKNDEMAVEGVLVFSLPRVVNPHLTVPAWPEMRIITSILRYDVKTA